MRRPLSERIFNVFNVLILTLLALVTFYPFWQVVCGSFSDGVMLMQHRGLLLFPKGFTLEAYAAVFNNGMVTSGLVNSIIVLVGGTVLNLVLTCIGAYVLSRKNV